MSNSNTLLTTIVGNTDNTTIIDGYVEADPNAKPFNFLVIDTTGKLNKTLPVKNDNPSIFTAGITAGVFNVFRSNY